VLFKLLVVLFKLLIVLFYVLLCVNVYSTTATWFQHNCS